MPITEKYLIKCLKQKSFNETVDYQLYNHIHTYCNQLDVL